MKRATPEKANPLAAIVLLLIGGLVLLGRATPPGPGPVVTPVAGGQLRVLVVEETADRTSLPAAQLAVLTSLTIRDYLKSHCAKGPGGSPEFRFLDKDDDLSRESALWQEAFKRPRQSVPWLSVTNGKSGFEGPLPGTVDATLQTLKKYGGE